MLYGQQLGYKDHKGNFEKRLLERDPKALDLFHKMEEVKKVAANFMKVRAVWQFFEVERDGNSVHLFSPGEKHPMHTFHYGRQARTNGLCLSDYVLDPVDGKRDHMAIFVVTAGESAREKSEEAKNQGEFFLAHALQALARVPRELPNGFTGAFAKTEAFPILPA